MEKVIALCVTAVLTISLIGYAICTAHRQYSDTSDNIGIASSELSIRLNNSNIISKDEAKRYYINRDKLEYNVNYIGKNVTFYLSKGDQTPLGLFKDSKITEDLDSLSSKAMFRVNKVMGKDGKISKIELKFIKQNK